MIPDPLYRQAKIRAVERGETFRELVLAALRRELAEAGSAPAESPAVERPDLFTINPQGFAVLKRKRGDTASVSNAWVKRMREEMGI